MCTSTWTFIASAPRSPWLMRPATSSATATSLTIRPSGADPWHVAAGHPGGVRIRLAGIGSDLGQLLMKGMLAVLIKIQRQVHGRNQPLFRQPGTVSLDPGDIGVVSHPGRQLGLAGGEGQATAAPHAAELDPQPLGEQAPQGEP